MGFLKVHQESVTPEIAEKMCEICPFHAISYNEGKLEIGAGCKMCKLCVKNGVSGVVTYEEEEVEEIDKSLWNGIAVFAEWEDGKIRNRSAEKNMWIFTMKPLTATDNEAMMALI